MDMNLDQSNSNVTVLKAKQTITLAQILKGDKDVRDFYKMIDKYDFREKAIQLLQAKIDKA